MLGSGQTLEDSPGARGIHLGVNASLGQVKLPVVAYGSYLLWELGSWPALENSLGLHMNRGIRAPKCCKQRGVDGA